MKHTRADQKHGRELDTREHGRLSQGSEAREGYGRIMPKDMAELDQGGTDLQVPAQRLVMKLSPENAARTSFWYVSSCGAL